MRVRPRRVSPAAQANTLFASHYAIRRMNLHTIVGIFSCGNLKHPVAAPPGKLARRSPGRASLVIPRRARGRLVRQLHRVQVVGEVAFVAALAGPAGVELGIAAQPHRKSRVAGDLDRAPEIEAAIGVERNAKNLAGDFDLEAPLDL